MLEVYLVGENEKCYSISTNDENIISEIPQDAYALITINDGLYIGGYEFPEKIHLGPICNLNELYYKIFLPSSPNEKLMKILNFKKDGRNINSLSFFMYSIANTIRDFRESGIDIGWEYIHTIPNDIIFPKDSSTFRLLFSNDTSYYNYLRIIIPKKTTVSFSNLDTYNILYIFSNETISIENKSDSDISISFSDFIKQLILQLEHNRHHEIDMESLDRVTNSFLSYISDHIDEYRAEDEIDLICHICDSYFIEHKYSKE